jgi:hypothetical protein
MGSENVGKLHLCEDFCVAWHQTVTQSPTSPVSDMTFCDRGLSHAAARSSGDVSLQGQRFHSHTNQTPAPQKFQVLCWDACFMLLSGLLEDVSLQGQLFSSHTNQNACTT